ncbi:BREX-1 system adenine-specific DNA-methyltransferase PglX [Planomicrobium chinense]|uniref:BREX-1 system adenine-specific DNA-methyltransferase PglX n=1 Tax=Planococcus chinensis TaxID=272917 RepID=UPI001CC7F02E|nr:BREX-1 system adenine-specific DNA-methyltransferase PglX [Planococcus chinensis]MBZ5201993.1 BREX-1 system adenine-specific DNA-methyltransferase PglX [Planococcus chinensis]
MDKKTLSRFAPTERIYLRAAVEKRLDNFGLNSESVPQFDEWLSKEGSTLIVNQNRYPDSSLRSFQGLYNEYKKVGYDQLVEELAYTWFNRFMAIRYMEVNGVLPDYVKIIERDPITRRPEIMDNYNHLNVNGKEIEELKINNEEEEAYRKLFLASANKLGEVMPFLFEPLQDWTELVLPDKMLEPNGVIDRILSEEGLTESFKDGVESIGWMYQYYIADLKSIVMKKKKTSKEELPARTQLFTPKWIVKYLVENSLGQLWLEAEENTALASQWNYFVEPAEQSPEVQRHLNEISYKNTELESITVLDPACGSGHILSYAYDLLFEMYLERGYTKREIPKLILTHNLYGIDIDTRAAQLAYFTLMMKAVESAGRVVWRNPVEPNIIAIQESNGIDLAFVELAFSNDSATLKEVKFLLEEYVDAREYGSLLQPASINIGLLEDMLKKVETDQLEIFNIMNGQSQENQIIRKLIQQHQLLTSQYDVVITNPPYMSNSTMNYKLGDFAKKWYPISKADLFAMFMERISDFTKEKGFNATINQHSWMFLTTYEKLRKRILNESVINSMLHLGTRTFEDIGGEVVQSTAYVSREIKEPNYNGLYIRLVEASNAINKEIEMLQREKSIIYTPKISDFMKIPGSPIAYWADESIHAAFKNNPSLNDLADVRQGLATADNNRFLRYWWEVDYSKIGFGMKSAKEAKSSRKKWFPFNKGGEFKKWYGNIEHVINWENDGEEIKGFKKSVIRNPSYMFRQGVTWSDISSAYFGVRYLPPGCLFGHTGSAVFLNSDRELKKILALLASKPVNTILKTSSQTLHHEVGQIKNIPIPAIDDSSLDKLIQNAEALIEKSKKDWDESERSWEYDPSIYKNNNNLKESYLKYTYLKEEDIQKTILLEKENNVVLTAIYGLEKIIHDIEVNNKEITLRLLEKDKYIRSFLSYFIGCTFGRYSLDEESISYARNNLKQLEYATYQPVKEGILTFTDEQVLPDEQDVYKQLQKFLSILYGEESLQGNLSFIAEALGKKPRETVEQAIRRYFMTDFIKDHIQLYKKRPIYWLIDSGKHKGMQSLMYLHRYTPYTLGLAMQNHFVPLLSQWRNLERVTLEEFENGEVTPVVKKELTKKLEVYQNRRIELETFQDKLNQLARKEIPIDLDDGVKVNYQKLNIILKEIKF